MNGHYHVSTRCFVHGDQTEETLNDTLLDERIKEETDRGGKVIAGRAYLILRQEGCIVAVVAMPDLPMRGPQVPRA